VILKSPPLMFRVHRFILSAHSQEFRDMFSQNRLSDAEKMDGIPIVNLSDNPEQLTYFLRALIDTW
jgi:BTB/POZ domain